MVCDLKCTVKLPLLTSRWLCIIKYRFSISIAIVSPFSNIN